MRRQAAPVRRGSPGAPSEAAQHGHGQHNSTQTRPCGPVPGPALAVRLHRAQPWPQQVPPRAARPAPTTMPAAAAAGAGRRSDKRHFSADCPPLRHCSEKWGHRGRRAGCCRWCGAEGSVPPRHPLLGGRRRQDQRCRRPGPQTMTRGRWRSRLPRLHSPRLRYRRRRAPPRLRPWPCARGGAQWSQRQRQRPARKALGDGGPPSEERPHPLPRGQHLSHPRHLPRPRHRPSAACAAPALRRRGVAEPPSASPGALAMAKRLPTQPSRDFRLVTTMTESRWDARWRTDWLGGVGSGKGAEHAWNKTVETIASMCHLGINCIRERDTRIRARVTRDFMRLRAETPPRDGRARAWRARRSPPEPASFHARGGAFPVRRGRHAGSP